MKPCKLEQHQTTKHSETVDQHREFFPQNKGTCGDEQAPAKKSFAWVGSNQKQATVASFGYCRQARFLFSWIDCTCIWVGAVGGISVYNGKKGIPLLINIVCTIIISKNLMCVGFSVSWFAY